MPQSLSAVYIHLVFSTKQRIPFLKDKNLRDRLHRQLGAISKAIDCQPLIVGGAEDHVHLLCRLGRTTQQSDWVKELKRVSSKWIKKEAPSLNDFSWQGGYAAFSVSQSNLEKVKSYIAEQENHHRERSFEDELLVLLERHKLDYDERFIWEIPSPAQHQPRRGCANGPPPSVHPPQSLPDSP